MKISNLSFSYDNTKILDDISFSVENGEFVSFLGESGCGKTTLLNILAGIFENFDGKLEFDFEKSTIPCAYMPQNDLLMPWKTVLKNVCLFGEIHGNYNIKQAESALCDFGLLKYKDMYPHKLSGGMKKRVAFLRTCMCESDILLLDEPFCALDVITKNDIQDWLIEIRKKISQSVVLVTHDIDEAIYLSNRIFILANGKIVREIKIEKNERTRDWLYLQNDLRTEIYNILRSFR